MIRRHVGALRLLLMLADAAVALTLVVVVFGLWFSVTGAQRGQASFSSAWAPFLLYSIMWVFLLFIAGEYRLRTRWRLSSEIRGITSATISLAMVSFSVLFLADFPNISRPALLILFPAQALVTIATRAALRWGFMYLRMRGRASRNLVIIGTTPKGYQFADLVEQHSAFGVRVIGFLGDPPRPGPVRWPYLGPISSIVEVFHEMVVDEAAICVSRSDWGDVEEIVRLCREEGKIVRIPLDAPGLEVGLRVVEDLDGVAVMSLVQRPDRVLSLAAKRLLDIVGAALAIIVLSPVLLGVAVFIRWRGGSPVLFRQTRVGMQGRTFTILKFRTMVTDAEVRFADIADRSETRGPAFKLATDPRITSWGRWLRRTSLDELPQLFNVLRGDMSLVGPRPAPPREVEAYDVWHRRRLSMKPGITGLWQVSSRRHRDFDDRARLDLDYIDRWSFWLDLRIVAMTIPAVLHLENR